MSNNFTITNFPEISAAQKKRVLVGVRPFRKGGIRLQKQLVKDKTIVHNYGHGGAGISLAPTTAQQTAQIVSSSCGKGQSISVIGSGIVGLMSALQCAARGYKVTIYADRIPVEGESNASIMCTSQIAPGYWLPYHYEFSDQKQHDRRSQKSYQKYLQYAKTSKSMRKIQVFQDMDLKQIKQKAPEFVSKTCKNVNVKIGTKQFPMVYFETLQIHLQHFLHQLIKQCQQKGVQFNSRRFNSVEQVVALSTKVIVNCMGLGSKKVFKDENMYGVKGHLIQINNSTKIKGIYGFKHHGEPVKMYCFDDKILLGLTKQYSDTNQLNPKLAQNLEQRAYSFYKSLGLNHPKAKL